MPPHAGACMALTTQHRRPFGRALMAVAGRVLPESWREPLEAIHPVDLLCFPPGEKRRDAAAADSSWSHSPAGKPSMRRTRSSWTKSLTKSSERTAGAGDRSRLSPTRLVSCVAHRYPSASLSRSTKPETPRCPTFRLGAAGGEPAGRRAPLRPVKRLTWNSGRQG